jgi:chromosome segregation ATPase
MNTACKLETVAAWIDSKYPNDLDPEVQNDLRSTADELRRKDVEIDALKQTIADMEEELHKCNVLEAAITKECNAFKEKIRKLEAEDISNGGEVCKYKTLYDATLTRVIKLEAEVSYMDALTNAKIEAETKWIEYETENKHLKERVLELEERRSETVAMCEQLLAENQRLRENVETWKATARHEADGLESWKDEAIRLRGALEKIATHGIYCSDTNELDSCDVMQEIAREALGQKKE